MFGYSGKHSHTFIFFREGTSISNRIQPFLRPFLPVARCGLPLSLQVNLRRWFREHGVVPHRDREGSTGARARPHRIPAPFVVVDGREGGRGRPRPWPDPV